MKNLCKISLVFAFPIIMYIVLGPIEICSRNGYELLFGWNDIWWEFIVVTILGIVFSSFLVGLLAIKPQKFIIHSVFIFSVLSYVQYLFLNKKLVSINGDRINWDAPDNVKLSLINLVIWIVIIIVMSLVIKCTQIKEYIHVISGVLTLVIILAIGFEWMRVGDTSGEEGKTLIVTDDKEFEVSKGENIIVIVLDQFSNNLFHDSVREDPHIEDFLCDFTFYDNANNEWATTFPSMTHLLTGIDYSNDFSSAGEWARAAWNAESTRHVYTNLQKAGYDCRIYSIEPATYGGVGSLSNYFTNVRESRLQVRRAYVPIKLCKMSAYRYLPYVLKPFFEVLSSEFDESVYFEDVYDNDNIHFYQEINKGLKISNNTDNSLIIYHLRGPHNPPDMNRYIQRVDEEETSRLDMGMGSLYVVNAYLQELKLIEKYDDSTIIVLSDHGIVNPDYDYEMDPYPIFMMKRKNDKGIKLEYSDMEVEYDDFCATIMDIIGVKDEKIPGKSIFMNNYEFTRERMIYFPVYDEKYPKLDGSGPNVYWGFEFKNGDADSVVTKYCSQEPDKVVEAMPYIY